MFSNHYDDVGNTRGPSNRHSLEREIGDIDCAIQMMVNAKDISNAAFDEVLATYPIAEMVQRGWLSGINNAEDLHDVPSLEWASRVEFPHGRRIKLYGRDRRANLR